MLVSGSVKGVKGWWPHKQWCEGISFIYSHRQIWKVLELNSYLSAAISCGCRLETIDAGICFRILTTEIVSLSLKQNCIAPIFVCFCVFCAVVEDSFSFFHKHKQNQLLIVINALIFAIWQF